MIECTICKKRIEHGITCKECLAKEPAEARRSAADCSPGSELRAGYKIAFSNYGQVKRWRILKIQNGLALVTEGWGVHKLLSVTSIAVAPYMIEQTRFPWYLRPFYRENARHLAAADGGPNPT